MKHNVEIIEWAKTLSSIFIPAQVRNELKLIPGPVSVVVDGIEEFSHTAKCNSNGVVSSMSIIYKKFGLEIGDEICIEKGADGSLILYLPEERLNRASIETQVEPEEQEYMVFDQKKLKHVLLEPFRPENLLNWEPETEDDVYFVFGVLQEYTDYRYCCGLTKSLISRLGYEYKDGTSKPDAVVVEEATGRYMIAEWKMNSSDFAINHAREDIDLLVVWNDDETDRNILPCNVIALRDMAKLVAVKMFSQKDM